MSCPRLGARGQRLSRPSRRIDLIVNEYTTNSPDHRRKANLRKAIQAIEISERDGEPAPVMGHDFLFIGSVGSSMNEESLRKNGITHVINWSNSARCNRFDGIEYLCVEGITSQSEMMHHIDELDKAVELVESVRKSGGKVLSHCWYGENRSVSLVVAYLMKHEGMAAAEATKVVRETRPQADPWWEAIFLYSEQYLDRVDPSQVERSTRGTLGSKKYLGSSGNF